MTEPTFSQYVISSMAPFWFLTDWRDDYPDLEARFDRAETIKAAWQVINALLAGLDAAELTTDQQRAFTDAIRPMEVSG